jgi:hypothetical protein
VTRRRVSTQIHNGREVSIVDRLPRRQPVQPAPPSTPPAVQDATGREIVVERLPGGGESWPCTLLPPSWPSSGQVVRRDGRWLP